MFRVFVEGGVTFMGGSTEIGFISCGHMYVARARVIHTRMALQLLYCVAIYRLV